MQLRAFWSIYIAVFCTVSFGCQKSFLQFLEREQDRSTHVSNQVNGGEDPGNDTVITESPTTDLSLVNCVHVYYDGTAVSGTTPAGKMYAVQLLNLLGHFAEFQRHVSHVSDYVSGDLQKCSVNIMVDSDYFSSIPATFVTDFMDSANTNQLAWVGQNAWKLGASNIRNTFGVTYNGPEPYTVLDQAHLVDGKPSFYKNVIYKGESFSKYGEFGSTSATSSTFYAAYEVAHFDYNLADVQNPLNHSMTAEIEHNYTLQKIPWAIQTNNRFLVVEVPFGYQHPRDRYLVFADLLFDILKAQPRHNSKPAVIRLEDAHSEIDLDGFARARAIFKLNSAPAHISVIPIYLNPDNPDYPYMGEGPREMVLNTDFMRILYGFQNDSAVMLWHGVTHQLGDSENPWTGVSGDDYEFWDYTNDILMNGVPGAGRPVPGETPLSVLTRLEQGARTFRRAGMNPKVWVTPHYHASSMDHLIFGRVFNWTVGRVVYYDYTFSGLNLAEHFDYISSTNVTDSVWVKRRQYLQNISVQQSLDMNPQFFPYEIYGDVYGQKVFPENLGNVQKELGQQVQNIRTVADMLADAARNRVLRDTWASGFYHTFYLSQSYWTNTNTLTNNDLYDLISGLKSLGYTFVNLETKASEWSETRARVVNYR